MKKCVTQPDLRVSDWSAAASIYWRQALTVLTAFFVATSGAATLNIPDATIKGLTHTFGHYAPFGAATMITDAPATGQFTQPGFTTMLTGSETLVMRFEAPAGQKFVIHVPPAGFGNVSLSLFGRWWAASSDGMQNPISRSFAFENLVGSTPSRTSSSDIMGSGGRLIRFDDTFTVTPGTEFTAVELSAQYAFSIVSPINGQFWLDSFSFQARVTSSSQVLGDGTLMTLETILRPTMNIECLADGFGVSWPTNFNKWVLETATQLGSSNNWSVVTNTYVTVGTNCLMTDMGMGPARYYRLKTQ